MLAVNCGIPCGYTQYIIHQLILDTLPQVTVINPKSVTLGRLYGEIDSISKDWNGGILSSLFRDLTNNRIGQPADRKWMLLDGPVDPIWVENLNTVLDDNKKLCLSNGEIIIMPQHMNMIFEVINLSSASPATVSRVGVVYMEPSVLTWTPLLSSWMLRMSKSLLSMDSNIILSHIEMLFHVLVDKSLKFVVKYLTSGHEGGSYVNQSHLVISCLNVLESLLPTFTTIHYDSSYNSADDELTREKVDVLVIFAMVWSIGVLGDLEYRRKFDDFLRSYFSHDSKGNCLVKFCTNTTINFRHIILPGGVGENGHALIYDYKLDVETCTWRPWMSSQDEWYRSHNNTSPLNEVELPGSNNNLNDILVPTQCVYQVGYLSKMMVGGKKPLLVIGDSGTGKTMYLRNVLNFHLKKDTYRSLLLTFSARTTCQQTQIQIDGRLEKRRRAPATNSATYFNGNIFTPSPVGKSMVIFIDDMSMPVNDPYGCQSAIELLRQYMDYGGWYDNSDTSFRYVHDIHFLCASGSCHNNGGIKNTVSTRLLRHFVLFNMLPLDDHTLTTIYSAIVNNYLCVSTIPEEISVLSSPLVLATLHLYTKVKMTFLPTPLKSHYIFSVRDISRLIRGVLLPDRNLFTTGAIDSYGLQRLWCHESQRVFCDRLVNEEERIKVMHYLEVCISKYFQNDVSKLYQTIKDSTDNICFQRSRTSDTNSPHSIVNKEGMAHEGREAHHNSVRSINQIQHYIWGAFASFPTSSLTYNECPNIARIMAVVKQGMDDYNTNAKKPLDLVIFEYALFHLSRICRILKMSDGNCLLVGLGGSGKKSLTLLATHMAGYALYQVEVTKTYSLFDWREDMKKLLKFVVFGKKEVVFLFSDSQMKEEDFIEDVNSILTTGAVPNLFTLEEKSVILESFRPYVSRKRGKTIAEAMSIDELYDLFSQRVKNNLHLVLCFSPVGEILRSRLHDYPSILNNCTINWVHPWPNEALESVAYSSLVRMDTIPEKYKHKVMRLCQILHQSTRRYCSDILTELHRHIYVTPTSFLELLKLFKNIMLTKKAEIESNIERYEIGLSKLNSTSMQVSVMQDELKELQPVIANSQEETHILMSMIEDRVPQVLSIREKVEGETQVAVVKAANAQAIQLECERDLANALPILAAALKSLDTLKPNDINEVKTLTSPPAGVRLVLQAICIMLNRKPITKMKAATTGGKQQRGAYAIYNCNMYSVSSALLFVSQLIIHKYHNTNLFFVL